MVVLKRSVYRFFSTMNSATGSRQPNLLPALFVFAFCMLMIAASRGMGETYGVFLLPISEDFGWNRASVTSVYSVYMIAFGIGSLLSGLVFDRLGPRYNYLIGLALLAGSYGLAGSVSSLLSFYLVIGVCGGVGSAMVGIVPAQSLISRWFFRRRTTALSIAYSGQGIGVMLLAPAAQLTIQEYGWQHAYTLASYGFIGALVLIFLMPWRRIARGAEEGPAPSPTTSARANARPESPRPAPNEGPNLRQALRMPEFWGFFTIYGATAISIFGISLQAVAYLVDQNYSIVHAAFAFGSMGMLTIVGIALTGILSEHYPRHIVATISYGLTLIGVAALAALQFHQNWALLTLFVVFFGLSAGARGPIIAAQMAELFAGRGLASIFGATNLGQGFGGATGAFMAGYLYDVTGSYNTGFIVGVLFALLGMSMFWLVPAIRYGIRRAPPPPADDT